MTSTESLAYALEEEANPEPTEHPLGPTVASSVPARGQRAVSLSKLTTSRSCVARGPSRRDHLCVRKLPGGTVTFLFTDIEG